MLRCYRNYGADPYYGNSAWHGGYYGNGYDNVNRHNNGYNSSGYHANSCTHNTNVSGNTVNVNNANRQNTSADRSNFSDASRGRGQNGSGREATVFIALVIMDRVVAAVGEIAQPVRVAGQAAAAVAVVPASAGAASVAVVSGYNSGDISWMPAEVQQKTWQDNDNDKVSALEGGNVARQGHEFAVLVVFALLALVIFVASCNKAPAKPAATEAA